MLAGLSSCLKWTGLNYSKLDGKEDDVLYMQTMLQTCTTLKCFALKEIQTATMNVIPDSQEGEFCCLKGWVDAHTLAPTKPDSGLAISVKKLNHVTHQERSEWLRKINNMGQLSHPNLVKLIGYCLEDDYPILVYEFLANGSLDNHLFKGSSNIQPLSWPVRMKIALDAAKGLAFLHSNEVQVMHGDFKTSNILIDSVSGFIDLTSLEMKSLC
ncbi:Interface between microtubules and kinetochore protein [Trifolium repens]|nr:receptor cytoplasmic kinase [Trifolium repens]WJX89462.1 Interface between microtubules and kinetochore protein [Trifolium repens]